MIFGAPERATIDDLAAWVCAKYAQGMMPSREPDHAPLLALGFHEFDMDALEQICVHDFALSSTRRSIFDGLKVFVERLQTLNVAGELWIDGSFLTEKINPHDVDIIYKCDASYYDNPINIEYHDAVSFVNDNQKSTLKCDSYVLFSYPADHALHEEGKWWYAYWQVKWGFSREEEPKGIAVIRLERRPAR